MALHAETHRWWDQPWFWAFMAVTMATSAVSLFSGSPPAPYFLVWGPLLFMVVYGPMGYRVEADARGLRVEGLGLARLMQAMYGFLWRNSEVVRGTPRLWLEVRENRGWRRWFGWPLLFTRGFPLVFGFGGRQSLRIHRPGFGVMTLDVDDAETFAALLALPKVDEAGSHGSASRPGEVAAYRS